VDTAVFVASKLLWGLLRPNNLALVLAVLGLLLVWRGRRFGRWPLALGLGWYSAVFALPVAAFLTLPLEERFARPTNSPSEVAGVVVLGGAVEQWLTEAHGIPALNGAAERMTEAVSLARRHPQARIVFTGGTSAVIPGGPTEADTARRLFADLGLVPERLVFESESRKHARERRPDPPPGPAARGRDLAADHLREPHAARRRLLPPSWLPCHTVARELHDRARRQLLVVRPLPHAAEPGRMGAAGVDRPRGLPAHGADRRALPGAVETAAARQFVSEAQSQSFDTFGSKTSAPIRD
jgi:hypothetical protein